MNARTAVNANVVNFILIGYTNSAMAVVISLIAAARAGESFRAKIGEREPGATRATGKRIRARATVRMPVIRGHAVDLPLAILEGTRAMRSRSAPAGVNCSSSSGAPS